MQTQVRTTFRNWFSPPIMWGLGIKLSPSGWLQASLPGESSHLPKSNRKMNTSTQSYNVEPSKDEVICSVFTVLTRLILHGFSVTDSNIPSPALTHMFPCRGASAEVLATPVRALSRPSSG